MKYLKLSRILWGISLLLLASINIAHAQTWSAWQPLSDGESDLLEYRTKVETDTTMADGYRMDFEIKSYYASSTSFSATFNIPIINPSDMQWTHYTERFDLHLSGNTTYEGSLDTDAINSLSISSMSIHSSDPDPELEDIFDPVP